jgi:hypothetical protein
LKVVDGFMENIKPYDLNIVRAITFNYSVPATQDIIECNSLNEIINSLNNKDVMFYSLDKGLVI